MVPRLIIQSLVTNLDFELQKSNNNFLVQSDVQSRVASIRYRTACSIFGSYVACGLVYSYKNWEF
jgi:hypothetical protein